MQTKMDQKVAFENITKSPFLKNKNLTLNKLCNKIILHQFQAMFLLNFKCT
jgi:hypothetical protein